MKKVLCIGLLGLCLTLSGCSEKEIKTTGKGNINGTTCEVEFVSNGDKISKSKEVITMDLTATGLTKDQAKMTMTPTVSKLNKIDGIDVKMKANDEDVTVTTEIDYEKTEIEDLKKAGLLTSSDANYVSLKASKKSYEQTFKVVFDEE